MPISRRAFAALLATAPFSCDRPSAPSPSLLPSPLPRPTVLASPPYLPPLWREYPTLAARLPRLALGELPTPIDPAPRLAERAGLGRLYIKRDDLGGLVYGGGKVRKLEILLAQALAAGARSVITFGGVGSHHTLATALYAAHLGLRAEAHLAPQPPLPEIRESLLATRRAGAELVFVRGVAEAEARARRLYQRDPAKAPFVIPTGGTSPLANLSFVNAAFELAEQIDKGQIPTPDFLYIAMGTMGSAVGLALGLKVLGLPTRLVAVRASSAESSSEAHFHALAKATVAHARRLDPSFPDIRLGSGDLRVVSNHLGSGYARPTPEGTRAMELALETEDLALESTYTAKALAALLGDAALLRDKVVLFWNTHNARPLVSEGVEARSLPKEFWPYLGEDV